MWRGSLIFYVANQGDVMYQDGIYKVIQENKGYVLINTKGERENHGHLKKLDTAKLVIKLMKKRIVPDSDYLRGTVLRVSTDRKYIEKVNQKIIKDRNKLGFININKGLVR